MSGRFSPRAWPSVNNLLLALSLWCGAWKIDTLESPDGGRAALVVSVNAKAPRPLVVWFHGGIGANNPSKGLLAAQGLAAWADSCGFALLVPSAWPGSPWWSASAVSRLETHLRQVGKRRSVDTRRIVFAGVSDGGSGALWLAAQMPALRTGALRGVAVWSTDPSVLVSRGAVLDPSLLKGIPVRWTAGGRDRLYPVSDVTAWWSRLRSASVPLESRLDPEADHDMTWHQQDFARFPAWAKPRLR